MATAPRTWLVCVDSSGSALNCVKHLISSMVSTSRGDQIILFSVQQDDQPLSEVESNIQKLVRLLASADSHLKLNQDDGVRYKVSIVQGSSTKKKVGKAILQAAQAEKVDYLIMGRRSSSVTKSVMGSVSDYVLEHTEIPVIIVPSTQ
eukprot:TRINITY_DN1817_c0_g1_i1.p1 TRINITY_DN1817_c0_g1~~TRINITY_DN1817_c0_g1_i1.p1  ORF type:complete len:168 (-),score=18.66 TRINITY_DN1817_c0_g1_i1:387-830(-)